MQHERWANKGIKVSKEGIGCVTCTQLLDFLFSFFPPLLHLTVSFFSSFSPSALSLSVLETSFFKLKQKHTGGIPDTINTHNTHTHTQTPERAACLHTRTHPRMHVHAYTHTCIHPLLRLLLHTHVYAQPQQQHTLMSTHVHNLKRHERPVTGSQLVHNVLYFSADNF